jgi:tripartite-type tricarboxylate transporter receptor subunit TctC
VVENKTGGGGNIGADFVAKAPADGYTLVMGNIGSHAVNPYLMKNMPYDPLKDFEPVAYVLDAEGLLVVNPAIPVKNVNELIAYVKARPGQVSYGSGGVGTTSHLAGELFKSLAKVDMTHIPYKGNAPAITDLIGGQTQVMFATMPTVLPYVKTDKLKALAVSTPKRTTSLPNVPTTVEAGVPNSEYVFWVGLIAPSGTAPAIIKKLNDEVVKTLNNQEVKDRFAKLGAETLPMSPEAFNTFIKAEMEVASKISKAANLKN